MNMTYYLDPTQDNGAALVRRRLTGNIVMLNLLRFRDIAVYSEFPDLAPPSPISGYEAYQRYMDHTLPYLTESGGSILYAGQGGTYFVSPADQGWDMVLLIRQTSLESLFSFAANPDYLEGTGHRTAALLDSRILPLTDIPRVQDSASNMNTRSS